LRGGEKHKWYGEPGADIAMYQSLYSLRQQPSIRPSGFAEEATVYANGLAGDEGGRFTR
jgi:hypothetical protein